MNITKQGRHHWLVTCEHCGWRYHTRTRVWADEIGEAHRVKKHPTFFDAIAKFGTAVRSLVKEVA